MLMNEHEEFSWKLLFKIAGAILCVVLIVCSAFTCFETVDTGHRGVHTTFGAVSENEVYKEGFHFKWPWTNIHDVDIRIKETEQPADSSSKDLQIVTTTVSVNYQVEPSQAWWVYQNIGPSFESWEQVKLNPIIQESVKSVTARYTAADLIKEREAVKNKIEEKIEARALEEAQLIVTAVNITNFDFSKTFNDSIEAKVKAEQDALRAKNELEKERIEQEKKIVQAEASKQKQILEAEGKAQSITLESEAQAKANKVLSESIDDKVLAFKQLEKWDGKLPRVKAGDGIGFLIPTPEE